MPEIIDDTGSKTATLIALLRHTPICRQLIPLEAAGGWPWMLRGVDRSLAVAVPFFAVATSQPGEPSPIYPPQAIIAVRWRTGLPIAYRDLTFDNPWPEADWHKSCGQFPHAAVAQMPVADYRALQKKAYGLFDQVFDAVDADQSPLPAVTAELRELLGQLVPPGHIPFYRKLASKFPGELLPHA